MSTNSPQVTAEILGETVLATVFTARPEADYGTGPRKAVVLDVDGSRFCVDESDVRPR